jgi:hypothetical protein
VALRELPTGLTLGSILGVIGIVRIVAWQMLGFYDYGPHWQLVAADHRRHTVGIVTFGSMTGSMLPFVLKRLGFDPASCLGAVRRDAGRCHRIGDLFQHRAGDPPRHAAVSQSTNENGGPLGRRFRFPINNANQAKLPWQCLYFLPEPQGQASLRPTRPQVDWSLGLRSSAATTRLSSSTATEPSPKSSSPVVPSMWWPKHPRRFRWRRIGGLAHELDAHQLRGHGLAQIAEHRLEQLEASDLYSLSGSRWA